MSEKNNDDANTQNLSKALEFTWGKYREYAATSGMLKSRLSKWRTTVLLLGIGGAIFGVLCQESIRLELDNYWEHMSSSLGYISSFLIVIAGYFGKELVKPETERAWIRARSMAEALKSLSFLYVTETAPYDKSNKAQLLLDSTNNLMESAKDLSTVKISDEQKLKRLLPLRLDVDKYLALRVTDQIKYYGDKAQEYAKRMKNIRNVGFVLGLVAVILGVLGSTGWTAGWIAVISTITSSIAAFVYANKFQYLIISYQATGNRLELLKVSWEIENTTPTDKSKIQDFIKSCEQAISIENSAWMAEYIDNDKGK